MDKKAVEAQQKGSEPVSPHLVALHRAVGDCLAPVVAGQHQFVRPGRLDDGDHDLVLCKARRDAREAAAKREERERERE
eukprot:SAG22_NODE_18659_length_283_cov_0.847826_1_plen_78_part_10